MADPHYPIETRKIQNPAFSNSEARVVCIRCPDSEEGRLLGRVRYFYDPYELPIVRGQNRDDFDSKSRIVLANPGVSREHCKVRLDNSGVYFLEDNKSTNGTFIGNERISRAALSHLSTFRVYTEYTFLFWAKGKQEELAQYLSKELGLQLKEPPY